MLIWFKLLFNFCIAIWVFLWIFSLVGLYIFSLILQSLYFCSVVCSKFNSFEYLFQKDKKYNSETDLFIFVTSIYLSTYKKKRKFKLDWYCKISFSHILPIFQLSMDTKRTFEENEKKITKNSFHRFSIVNTVSWKRNLKPI